MPQITASTARRSMERRARSSAERFCACADVAAQMKVSAATLVLFMALLRWGLVSQAIGAIARLGDQDSEEARIAETPREGYASPHPAKSPPLQRVNAPTPRFRHTQSCA